MPSFLTNLAGGKSIADLKAPRSRRGNTNQVVDYWFGGLVAGGDYESIATTTVGSGGSSTVTFSSIPSTFKHLQIRAIARDASATNDVTSIKLVINSDTSSTYTRHILYADGSSVSSAYNATTGFCYAGGVVQGGFTANVFAANVMDILDYANTNKYKTLRNLSGADGNGSGQMTLVSNLWQSSSAITTLSFTSFSGSNFAQYSQFALYGIKG